MTEPATPFARLLGDLRLTRRLSVPAVAEATGVSPKTIHHSESGESWPRVDTLGRLLRYYDSVTPVTTEPMVGLVIAAMRVGVVS
jgi:transcriptional regulator with XRE-family HTH domain